MAHHNLTYGNGNLPQVTPSPPKAEEEEKPEEPVEEEPKSWEDIEVPTIDRGPPVVSTSHDRPTRPTSTGGEESASEKALVYSIAELKR